MTKQELKEYCVDAVRTTSNISDDVNDLYQIACEEILEGYSEHQACEQAVQSIDELIELNQTK